MKKIAACLLFSLLTACAMKAPQSPEEFVSHFSGGAGMGKKITSIEVSRPYKNVMGAIENYSNTCVNKKIIVTTLKQGMYYSKTHNEYRAKITKKNDGPSFFSVQVIHNDLAQKGAPADGYYLLVSEIKPINGSKTSITTYYSWGSAYENITYYLNEWAAGKSKDCPKLD